MTFESMEANWLEPDDNPFEAAIEAGWIDPDDVSKALLDVLEERNRQETQEGWTPEHDDRHAHGQLAGAAAAYAAYRSQVEPVDGGDLIQLLWPWAQNWWKPKDPRRDLVRAAALIIAEIERLDRAAAKVTP